MNHSTDSIAAIITECKTIAIVGFSPKPERPSHGVAQYLQRHGYRIVPINPGLSGTQQLGETCYANLTEAADAIKQEGGQIEMVDCFRRSEAIDQLADEAIAIGARCLWMQLGVINSTAAGKARAAGLAVVVDRCTKIEHAVLFA